MVRDAYDWSIPVDHPLQEGDVEALCGDDHRCAPIHGLGKPVVAPLVNGIGDFNDLLAYQIIFRNELYLLFGEISFTLIFHVNIRLSRFFSLLGFDRFLSMTREGSIVLIIIVAILLIVNVILTFFFFL